MTLELKAAPKPAGVKSASTTPTRGKNGKSAPSSGQGWNFGTSVQVLAGVLDKSGLPYKVIQKDTKQGRIFAFENCPHHTDPDGDHYECSVLVTPDGKFGANCFHDGEASWQTFKPLIGWTEHIAEVKAELALTATTEYKESPAGLVWLKPTKDGHVPTVLANFTARVLRTAIEDDGEERRVALDIEARLRGRYAAIRVPASDFGTLNWAVECLGAGAILSPGNGLRDRARHAIQTLSGEIPTEVAYAHTGWARIDGKMVYLHAGGAIGEDGPVPGVRVALTGPFGRFELPPPPDDETLARAVRASRRLLWIAPPAVSAPLFAATYRAPLGATDFSIFASGPTGNGKTAIASLIQQHWGAGLDYKHVPGNWSSTANSNEGLAFAAKDAVMLIDDFAPGNSALDTARLHRDADRIFRNAGNGTGRGRMRADSTLKTTKYPRGLILSTGEDIPKGQSVRARLMVIEISPGTVAWEKVTERQKDADQGRFAVAMAGYVRWLAGRYEEVMAAKPSRVAKLRELATDSEHHKRTPGAVAELFFGVEQFCSYAREIGAITEKQEKTTRDRVWKGLGEAASCQIMIQANGEPVQRFLDLLAAAIAAGKGHVAALDGSAPPNANGWGWRNSGARQEPRGDRVGWITGNDLYIEPEASYALAQKMAAEGGEPIAVTSRTLHKRLKEKNKLVAIDEARQRLTLRRTVQGMVREVLFLRATSLGLSSKKT